MIKIDVGCGNNCREGYVGIDKQDFGQKYILDIAKNDLPFKDNSVDEVYCSHMLEHLEGERIIYLVNTEFHRVLKKGGQLWIVVPHKDHPKAYTLWHKSFFTKFTFTNLLEEVSYHNVVTGHKKNLWRITELVKNDRPDIHCKAIKL